MFMKPELTKYSGMKICVAVSGGKDSMALLHYMQDHCKEYNITLSALNCDHMIRGESSARDSAFVNEYCSVNKIPLLFFRRSGGISADENAARKWRRECYALAVTDINSANNDLSFEIYTENGIWTGADAVATAHHLNDNSETVLFNLSRGSALSGLCGIRDSQLGGCRIIHPLLNCLREEIDAYVLENSVPYVEDETNLSDRYTRNKIRLNILPDLERAVPGAIKNISRFSARAAEDEEYFENIIIKLGLLSQEIDGCALSFCKERAIFKRAALKAIKFFGNKIDYTADHLDKLYELQFADLGKKFCFLGLEVIKEDKKIVFYPSEQNDKKFCGVPFNSYVSEKKHSYCGELLFITNSEADFDKSTLCLRNDEGYRVPGKLRILRFDLDAIPSTAQVRFMERGDRFTKFGGGTKNLGDYFTDKKIPQRRRKTIPLVADGNDILIVGGMEISDKVKITDKTVRTAYAVCADKRP